MESTEESALTPEDVLACKMIGVLQMVAILLLEIRADRRLGEKRAAEKAVNRYIELIRRTTELFGNPESMSSDIVKFAKYLGFGIEVERIE